MSDKDNAKPAKNVMGNLPSTRPTRLGRRRDGDPVTRDAPAAAATRPDSRSKSRAAKPKPARATPKATGRPAGERGKPATTARPASPKPRAVRSGSPSLAAAKKASATPRREPAAAGRDKPAAAPPKGTELVTTAVQATGELAKIGLTLGGQAIKRAARRLPKP